MSKADQYRNVLPEKLKIHRYAGKHQYIDYDEELGIPVVPSVFVVDTLPKLLMYPTSIQGDDDIFEEMKHNTMEKGDYLLSCPMKTGQHWFLVIMSMLKAGSATYIQAEKETSWIDKHSLDDIYSRYESPRVLHTHLGLSWLPKNFRRDDTKVVITLRDMKDSFVSKYFHYKKLLSDEEFTWSDMYKLCMHSKYSAFGSYFDLYADAWDNYRHDPNVLLVFYEDLTHVPVATIEKIAKHMDVPYTPQLLSEIADAVDISKMKAAKQKIREDAGDNEQPFLYRTGYTGDWKNPFTDAQNEEFERVMARWKRDKKIPFMPENIFYCPEFERVMAAWNTETQYHE